MQCCQELILAAKLVRSVYKRPRAHSRQENGGFHGPLANCVDHVLDILTHGQWNFAQGWRIYGVAAMARNKRGQLRGHAALQDHDSPSFKVCHARLASGL